MSSEPATILFTPFVPPHQRANGWTTDAQIAFIAALARTGVVAVAARGVGKSARSAITCAPARVPRASPTPGTAP